MSTIDKIIQQLNIIGKTQKDLTDYLGVDKSTFSAWKSNKSKSYLKYIKQISVFLGISVENLLNNDSEKLPEEYIILSRKMKKMTPEQLKQLSDVAKVMFGEDFDA